MQTNMKLIPLILCHQASVACFAPLCPQSSTILVHSLHVYYCLMKVYDDNILHLMNFQKFPSVVLEKDL